MTRRTILGFLGAALLALMLSACCDDGCGDGQCHDHDHGHHGHH
jgi:hypothetical protein